MNGPVGILVFGDNHLILRGPQPTEAQAYAMTRHWSSIQLGKPPGETFCLWTIRTKEFRENLAWAVIVPGEGRQTDAVTNLLSELAARGVPARVYRQAATTSSTSARSWRPSLG